MDGRGSITEFAEAAVTASSCEQTKLRVVVIEDDDIFREMLTAELEEQGFSVLALPDGRPLLESPEIAADADIIVIDWALPHITGIDLLPRLRKLGITVPVVFLTGRPLTINEAMAFDRGALDFVDKARGISILIHRLRVAAKSKSSDICCQDSSQVCGRLVLKPHVSRAYWDDMDVNLTVSEFRIVHLLARNVGQHVSYREIYDNVRYRGFISGSGENGYKANVRSTIKRIRRKFRELDPSFAEIENFAAFGYVWGRALRPAVA